MMVMCISPKMKKQYGDTQIGTRPFGLIEIYVTAVTFYFFFRVSKIMRSIMLALSGGNVCSIGCTKSNRIAATMVRTGLALDSSLLDEG